MKAIHEGRRFPCKQCDSENTRAASLEKHTEATHDNPDKVFSCDICSFSARREDGLKKHQQFIYERDGRKHFCEEIHFHWTAAQP